MTLPGTLFVVATPIGNLEDITLRALRVLREVDLVAAEDTRRTGNLLRHYEIRTPLLSVHAHNETARIPAVIARLLAGQSVALVSDAGTPAVSDPGAALVRAVRDAGIQVVPVPGASAVTAVLSAAGLRDGPFCFEGFPPNRSNARAAWLARLAVRRDHTTVFFEAPHRVKRTLAELASLLGERPIILAREVSKLHEEWLEGPASELARHIYEPRGEYVVVVPAAADQEAPTVSTDDGAVAALFGQLTEIASVSRREAVREVAKRTGLTVRQVYAAVERHKSVGN